MSPKTGRPKSDNPKCYDIKVRLDAATHEKLLQYCNKTGETKAEAIRTAINLILDKKK